MLDIDADIFLDHYVEQGRNSKEISQFVNSDVCRLLETSDSILINQYPRLAVILEAFFSWLPFIRDSIILRKTLTFITRVTNLKQELRRLMCQSTFLSYRSLQSQSLQ